MTGATVEISVVVPCHDEEENLRPLVLAIRGALDPLRRSYEVILVDDGSADGSWQAMRALAAEFPFLRALRLRRNSGQSAALEAGSRAARGAIVATLDADFQNDPGDLPRLLEALKDCDCACGDRSESRRQGYGWLRIVSSAIANRVRNALTGESFADSACNLRAMRRECLERVRFFDGAHRFLSTLIKMEGFKVLEVPISSRPRLHGRSKYGVWNRLFRAFRDLLGVRWMKSRRLDYEVAERSDEG